MPRYPKGAWEVWIHAHYALPCWVVQWCDPVTGEVSEQVCSGVVLVGQFCTVAHEGTIYPSAYIQTLEGTVTVRGAIAEVHSKDRGVA